MFSRSTFVPFLAALILLGCSPSDGENNNNNPDVPDSSLEDVGWLLHVNGRSGSDIDVVGGAPNGGRLLHFDGEDWAEDEVPSGTPLLNWIHPFATEKVVVGNAGTVLWNDGSGWVEESTPTDRDLWGVWGSSVDDVWAVGGNGRESGQATVIRRVNGEWQNVALPTLERPGVNAWFKVWGSAADDVYIVGQRGAMVHWDGSAFEELGLGTSRDLISIHGVASDAIMVVGGRSNGVISYFDGNQWTTQELSPAPGVNGVWMTSRTTAWIAGVRGLLREATVSDGAVEVPRIPPVSDTDLHAVGVFEDYGLLSVGGNFESQQGPYRGVAIHKDTL